MLLVAGGLRVATWLLAPAWPLLVTLGALAAVFLFLSRPRL
jgi:hypothetical protein